jgi:hypothetical protein
MALNFLTRVSGVHIPRILDAESECFLDISSLRNDLDATVSTCEHLPHFCPRQIYATERKVAILR